MCYEDSMKTLDSLRAQVRSLSKSDLMEQAWQLVKNERKIQAEFLVYLERIEELGLHLESASSLHDFLTRKWGFSGGSAHRRIQALGLMKSVPAVKAAIEEGKASLSSASQLQGFLKKEAKLKGEAVSAEKKQELFEAIQGKSRRETEKLFATISPEAALPADSERPLTEKHSLLKVVVDSKVIEELERLRELLAHHRPAPQTLGEIIAFVTTQTLDRLDPERKAARVKKTPKENIATENTSKEKIPKVSTPAVTASNPGLAESIPPKTETPPAGKVCVTAGGMANERPPIPADLKRAVQERDGHHCTWKYPDGRRCPSRYGIEIDHVILVSRGGKTSLENLRLLCHSHHRYVTIRALGARKMARYRGRKTA